MRIPRDLLDEIVAHAREDAPNECCGLITAKDGVATRVHRADNAKASPLAFEIAPAEQLRLYDEIDEREDEDGQVAAVYHSHVRTEAFPSQTDINYSKGWQGIEWVIVGLREDEPEVRSFLIEDGRVREVALE